MTRPTPTTPATATTATPTPTPADRPADRPVDRPTPVPATSAPAAIEDARLRQPTASQKLEIVLMLAEVYDRKAGRYKGSETDATVAAALEDGIMPGWVAVQRAELFGPSGANEDMSRLGAEVAVLRDKTERELRALRLHMESAEGQTRAITESLEALVAIEKRLQSLVASAGPKARSR